MSLLHRDEIEAGLRDLPGWHHRGNALERVFLCENFDGSLAFVNAVGALANQQDHHPDIGISWNRVTVTLSSHDAGGITDRDFALARAIEAIAPAG